VMGSHDLAGVSCPRTMRHVPPGPGAGQASALDIAVQAQRKRPPYGCTAQEAKGVNGMHVCAAGSCQHAFQVCGRAFAVGQCGL
jgi:hypothetical protein